MGHSAVQFIAIFRTNPYLLALIMSGESDVPADKGPKGKKRESKAVVRENVGAREAGQGNDRCYCRKPL